MPPAAPPPFAVECACGTVVRGARSPKPQVLTCAGCGKPVFVFPAAASVFGPAAAAAPMPAWAGRLRFWLPPAAAAVLALAVVGMVIAAIVRGHRPAPGVATGAEVSEARAAILLTDRHNAAHAALEEGSYRLALRELDAARDLLARHPRAVDPERANQLRRWRRQADLLADLLPESVSDIVRHSVGRADREWDAVFRERYAGKSLVLDARVFRDAAGHVHVDYQLEAAGGVGEWDFDQLKLLDGLPLQQPQRLMFGFRLRAVRRLARDRWTVVPEPDSGVLLTDPVVLTGLSVPADDELSEVLRRQAAWVTDG
jgi:hypothetical protein